MNFILLHLKHHAFDVASPNFSRFCTLLTRQSELFILKREILQFFMPANLAQFLLFYFETNSNFLAIEASCKRIFMKARCTIVEIFSNDL